MQLVGEDPHREINPRIPAIAGPFMHIREEYLHRRGIGAFAARQIGPDIMIATRQEQEAVIRFKYFVVVRHTAF